MGVIPVVRDARHTRRNRCCVPGASSRDSPGDTEWRGFPVHHCAAARAEADGHDRPCVVVVAATLSSHCFILLAARGKSTRRIRVHSSAGRLGVARARSPAVSRRAPWPPSAWLPGDVSPTRRRTRRWHGIGSDTISLSGRCATPHREQLTHGSTADACFSSQSSVARMAPSPAAARTARGLAPSGGVARRRRRRRPTPRSRATAAAGTIEAARSRVGACGVRHLHEGEAARPTGLAIRDHLDPIHSAVRLEERAQLALGDGEGRFPTQSFFSKRGPRADGARRAPRSQHLRSVRRNTRQWSLRSRGALRLRPSGRGPSQRRRRRRHVQRGEDRRGCEARAGISQGE